MYLRIHDGDGKVRDSVKMDSGTSETTLKQLADRIFFYNQGWFDKELNKFSVCRVSLLLERHERITFSTEKFKSSKEGRVFYLYT